MNLLQFDSLAELRLAAPRWNDLWRRSALTLPAARAELLAAWCTCFAADKPFGAVVVEDDGRFVAAISWIEKRRFGVRYASLPGNHWSAAGELLLDPSDSGAACDLLVAGLKRHAGGLFLCDAVPAGSQRWRQFTAALDRHGVSWLSRPRFSVNCVSIASDWQAYLDARSRNHRRHVRRAAARAVLEGATELTFHERFAPHEIERLLRGCFAIESSGWKGQAGASVLQTPDAWNFYLQQARQLAAWGEWRVAILRLGGLPIAFEYGWLAKGVYSTPKVGYDETFARLSPGQLLRYRLFEQFHRRDDVESIDFFGPASDATTKWATDSYSIDRLAVALDGPLARTALAAYRHVGPLLRRIRGGQAQAALVPSASPGDEPLAVSVGPRSAID